MNRRGLEEKSAQKKRAPFTRRNGSPSPLLAGAKEKGAPARLDDQLVMRGVDKQQDLQVLEGSVERIVFTNEENGWTVLKISVSDKHGSEEVSVVGRLFGVREGEGLRLWGSWADNPRFGRQFQVERFVPVGPATIRGILKYLSSGLVPGIGPSLAHRLVEAFGVETLEVIERHPRRLRKVEGIGPKRSRVIQQAFKEQKATRDALVFLQGHGLGTAQSHKVLKQYGEQVVGLIQQNPYRMVWEVSGIGFLTADRMARQMGISISDPQRIQAALAHELEVAGEEGHCFLPESVLVKRASARLSIDEDEVRSGLVSLLKRKVVKAEPPEAVLPDLDERAIYPSSLRLAEHLASQELCRLLTRPLPRLAIDREKACQWVQKKLSLDLSDRQKDALHLSLQEKVAIITGGPGTGKTTLLRALIEIFSAKKLSISLAAPTGRAARRLKELTGRDAQTVHRLLEYAPRDGRFQRDADHPLGCDLCVVDEVSMVDIVLFSALLLALPDQCRLILVGDSDQLPSVGPGSVLSDLLASTIVPVARLTEIFRQARRSQIVVAAHQVNKGSALEPGPGSDDGQLFFVNRPDPAELADTICELVEKRIPGKYQLDAIRDVQVLCPMKRGLMGTEQLNRRLRDLLNPAGGESDKGVFRFRPGDKVMQIRNNYDKEVFNGDMGVVLTADGKSERLRVVFDGRIVEYERAQQDELLLSYACTVHKSQGSEYKAVVIPVHTQHYMMLQRNLLYTAITRARKLCVLVGSRKALDLAIANDRLQHRYTGLSERIRRCLGSANLEGKGR